MRERILHIGANFFCGEGASPLLADLTSDVVASFGDALRMMRLQPYSLVLVDAALAGEWDEDFAVLASSHHSIIIGVETATTGAVDIYRMSRFDLAVRLPEEAAILERVISQIMMSRVNSALYMLNEEAHSLSSRGRQMKLSRLEYLLLHEMATSGQPLYSVAQIKEFLVGSQEGYQGVAVLISRLQRKARRAFDGESLLRSVRNHGYCLVQRIDVRRSERDAEAFER